MTSKPLTALLLALAIGFPALAGAHHSFAGFDQNQVVSIKGTVKDFQWTNPHTWLQVVVVNEGGVAEEWALEGLSPNVLGRMGWKRNSVAAGDVITVYFNPTRNGSHGGNLVKIVRADGSQVPVAGSTP
jgi:hypothetical protein